MENESIFDRIVIVHAKEVMQIAASVEKLKLAVAKEIMRDEEDSLDESLNDLYGKILGNELAIVLYTIFKMNSI